MKDNLAVKRTSEYKAISIEETFRLLETSADGFADPEVQRRHWYHGHRIRPEVLLPCCP